MRKVMVIGIIGIASCCFFLGCGNSDRKDWDSGYNSAWEYAEAPLLSWTVRQKKKDMNREGLTLMLMMKDITMVEMAMVLSTPKMPSTWTAITKARREKVLMDEYDHFLKFVVYQLCFIVTKSIYEAKNIRARNG